MIYLDGPDDQRVTLKPLHWWSFMRRYPDSRLVRFVQALPTVRVSLHKPPDHKSFDPPEA